MTTADLLRATTDAGRIRIGEASSRVPTALTAGEQLALYAAAYNGAGDYLEIGTLFGGSASIVASAMDAKGRLGKVVCVDPRRHAEPTADALAVIGTRGVFVIGESPGVVAAMVGQRFGLAFIDGDHSAEAVAADFWAVVPLMATGGTILFHDALNPDVFASINRVSQGLIAGGRIMDLGWRSAEPHFENGITWGGVREFKVIA